MTDSIRLAKRVAELRACSRREAELLITGGWVQVDGAVIEEPQFRVSNQHIEIDVKADLSQSEPVTLLLNKPAGYDAWRDGKGDKPASQLLLAENLWSEVAVNIRPLKKHFSQQTFCVPLETEASGLVIFTQDWRIARKLTENAATLEHEYLVEVAGELGEKGLKKLGRGTPYHPQGVGRDCKDAKASTITLNGRTPAAIKVSWQNEKTLRVALKGAQVGQIAHLLTTVELQVLSMRRVRLGGVPLGKLPMGQWRYLYEDERF